MSNQAQLTPMPPQQRLPALDALRGFALLGIFLMNIEFFAKPLQDIGADGIDPGLHGIDWWADALVYFFVQGKFWTLFSLLFGIGFGVMLARANASGRAFVPLYLRRSLVLLGIGLVHALLIWSGDILVSYAIGALLLLGFHLARRAWRGALERKPPAQVAPLEPEVLGVLGIGSYSLVLAMLLLGALMVQVSPKPAPDSPEAIQALHEKAENKAHDERERAIAIAAYRDDGYAQATRQRAIDTREQMQQLPLFLPMLLGVFALGAGIARTSILHRPQEHTALLRGVRNLGLPLGFALTGLSVALGTASSDADFGAKYAVQVASFNAGALLLSLSYAAAFLSALQTRFGATLQNALAPAGRMALSNYLSQSLLASLLFYHYGFGWWGHVGRAAQVLLVFAVFALQLQLSRWWLARFRFGPVEWLWRSLTYLESQPMRVA